MTASRPVRPHTTPAEAPPVPLTIEGYSVLHQMFRFRWAAWRELPAAQKTELVSQAARLLGGWEQEKQGQSAFYSLLGHKGDLLLVHFRSSFDELSRAEVQLSKLRFSDFLEPTSS